MLIVIHRGTARINAHFGMIERFEVFNGARARVINANLIRHKMRIILLSF